MSRGDNIALSIHAHVKVSHLKSPLANGLDIGGRNNVCS